MTTWIDWIIALGAMSGWGMLVLRLHLEGSSRQRQIEVLEAVRGRLENDAHEANRARAQLAERSTILGRRLRQQYQQTLVLRRMVEHLCGRLAPIEGCGAVTIRRRAEEAVRRQSGDGLRLISAYASPRGIERRIDQLDHLEAGDPRAHDGWQPGSMNRPQADRAA